VKRKNREKANLEERKRSLKTDKYLRR